MITEAFIDMNEYCHSLVIKTDDGWKLSTHIHSTGVKPPPIDLSGLEGQRTLWMLKKIAGLEAGEFPRS